MVPEPRESVLSTAAVFQQTVGQPAKNHRTERFQTRQRIRYSVVERPVDLGTKQIKRCSRGVFQRV
jgi:hypothetical protein